MDGVQETTYLGSLGRKSEIYETSTHSALHLETGRGFWLTYFLLLMTAGSLLTWSCTSYLSRSISLQGEVQADSNATFVKLSIPKERVARVRAGQEAILAFESSKLSDVVSIRLLISKDPLWEDGGFIVPVPLTSADKEFLSSKGVRLFAKRPVNAEITLGRERTIRILLGI